MQPYDNELPYCAAKAGVLAFAKGLSRSYAREGLLVNCFAEVHGIDVDATPPACWEAIRSVTTDEMPLTRALMSVRMLRRDAVPRGKRAVDALPPTIAGEDPPRELLLTLESGDLRIGMNLSVAARPDGHATRVTTTTRVRAGSPQARRVFALYWLAIRGGSGLIRRELLRAVARRASSAR